MKSIALYGLKGGFIIFLVVIFRYVPFFEIYISSEIVVVFRFVTFVGIMMFAINHFIAQNKYYNFGAGFLIAIGTGISCIIVETVLSSVFFSFFKDYQYNVSINLLSLRLPQLIFCALLVQIFFRKNDSVKKESDDSLLDDEFFDKK